MIYSFTIFDQYSCTSQDCSDKDYPNVFARFSSVMDWIKHTACTRRQDLCNKKPPFSSGWQSPPSTTIQGLHNEWH